jgi:arsenate reductase
MYTELETTLSRIKNLEVSAERKAVLKPLVSYIQSKVDTKQDCVLNFICTHNSRRSQLAQIWAQTAADLAGVSLTCLSGGVEVTAFNERAVASIKRSGFKVEHSGSDNPKYAVSHSENQEPLICFSKLFDDTANRAEHFAAIMVCSDADENCPFIPGTEARIPVRYEDPKAFDGTELESDMYDERSMQIASEMFYVFNSINYT